ncbi:transmembrane protein 53-A-like [Oculina patagonica]
MTLRTKKCSFTLCLMFRQFVPAHHRRKMSESTHFQAKCKKISAVVTRVGTKSSSTSPVVALLGWSSAPDKHLAKYSEIFEQKGFDTVRIPSDPFNTLIRLNKVKEISLGLLDVLVEMKSQQNRPFIFYVMSMGGFNMYYFINQALSTPGQLYFNSIHVIGCVFDSCPLFPGIHNLKDIQSVVLENIPNPLIRVPVWIGLAVVCTPVLLFDSALKKIIPESMASPLGCPELFLFCKNDPMFPAENIQVLIDSHRNRNIQVFSKCWEVSSHVQHYKNHPEEYLRAINTFTDYCLKQHWTSRASKL